MYAAKSARIKMSAELPLAMLTTREGFVPAVKHHLAEVLYGSVPRRSSGTSHC